MTSYIVRRFGQSFLLLIAMSLIVFAGINAIGDPVELLVEA